MSPPRSWRGQAARTRVPYRVRVGERQPGRVDSQVPRVADELARQRMAQLATFAEPGRGPTARSRLRR